MAYHITAAEVQGRLRTLTAVDVPDATLALTPFIPAADAWIDKVLVNNSKTFATLTAPDDTLAKAAEIAYVCHKVINSAPLHSHKTGPIEVKDITAADKREICSMFEKEYTDILNQMGCTLSTFHVDTEELNIYDSSNNILS